MPREVIMGWMGPVERYKLHCQFNIIMLENWTIDELKYMHLTVMEEE
jgi:hypothetical protein